MRLLVCALSAVAQSDDAAVPAPAPAVSAPAQRDPLSGSKIDCGGWKYPDSHKNTKRTIYGKIGYICTSDGKQRTGGHNDKPYVCWNEHLYEGFVDWSLVVGYFFLFPFLLAQTVCMGSSGQGGLV
jgi:hypothetical protein